jgi:hypothetical protein
VFSFAFSLSLWERGWGEGLCVVLYTLPQLLPKGEEETSKGHPLTQVVLTKIALEIRDLESDPKNYNAGELTYWPVNY